MPARFYSLLPYEFKISKFSVQDDPKLLGDGSEVPKPNGVVAGSISSGSKFFT